MTQKMLPVLAISMLLSASLLSCKGDNAKKSTENSSSSVKALPYIVVSNPTEGSTVAEGDDISLAYTLPQEAANPDSVVVTLNNRAVASGKQTTVTIPTKGLMMGTQSINLTAYKSGEKVADKYMVVNVKPATQPVSYSYKVVKTFPHDTQAYTQGLTFDNNILYEGTGQRGISDLRIVDLKSGQVEKSIPLPNYIFGEGIAILGDKIYQLSWQEQRGFVYSKKSFEKVGEFTYPGEGWGLTTDGKVLYMSDGSKAIRIIDPNTLTEVSRFEVYDNKGPVDYLNELEYIDGEIWANVYLTDRIVRIDPQTGKVVGSINFANLLPNTDRTENTDVLNGIAYNKNTGQIYVTGKNWPKLFEIKVVKK